MKGPDNLPWFGWTHRTTPSKSETSSISEVKTRNELVGIRRTRQGTRRGSGTERSNKRDMESGDGLDFSSDRPRNETKRDTKIGGLIPGLVRSLNPDLLALTERT